MLKSFICNNAFAISTTLSHFSFPYPFSHKFLTTTTTSHSFTVSYLINNFNFSSELALKASKQVHFNTPNKADSVINFFTTHGFTDTDIQKIVKREPWLLSCDTHKRVLPKFQFLLSKGASPSDIVGIAVGNPRFMKTSLKNRVIPLYNLVNQFICSDQKTLASIISCPSLLCSDFVDSNIKLLVENGVCNSSIFRILRSRPSIIFCSPRELAESVEELKKLGLNPSMSFFGDALLAKRGISESKWNEKIDTFKKWGWSEETILEAIRRQPKCMLSSNDKINRVMEFWVNELGWDSSYLVKGPGIFGYGLEKRVIPRAMIVRYLLNKGLRSESASLLTPFYLSEKLFLERYVLCFEEEEKSYLLKLYYEMMKVENEKGQKNPES
ncbi:transcription termination factor MTERF15, mitochondrial-like [Cicer arietinum]|uniref:transcription termination factor MTERF15, mitochondrial-like n=1 Tax=Cicer arietinum TaxID=3827 RepID=UPI00032AC46C